jgi:hypothetical protein
MRSRKHSWHDLQTWRLSVCGWARVHSLPPMAQARSTCSTGGALCARRTSCSAACCLRSTRTRTLYRRSCDAQHLICHMVCARCSRTHGSPGTRCLLLASRPVLVCRWRFRKPCALSIVFPVLAEAALEQSAEYDRVGLESSHKAWPPRGLVHTAALQPRSSHAKRKQLMLWRNRRSISGKRLPRLFAVLTLFAKPSQGLSLLVGTTFCSSAAPADQSWYRWMILS